MIAASSSTLSLSNLHARPNSPNSTATGTIASSLPSQTKGADSSSDPPPRRKYKTSPQLNRWSRARSIRSGRKLVRRVEQIPPTTNTELMEPSSPSVLSAESRGGSPIVSPRGIVSESEEEAEVMAGKPIYMVSDGTGWTAEHSVNAALGQFEHCLVDRVCPVNTHLFSGIEDVERLMEIIKQAAKEGAMVAYTLADPSMAESARRACELWNIPSTDILGPITEAIAAHLGVSPSGLPRWAPGRKHSLTDEYFNRIEAIEFTIKQDDGALPENLHKADIVLAGVSRTGKTPLSIYLAQKGYKVANVPIVMGVAFPKSVLDIDPEKVFGLTISPVVLHAIRRARAKSLGFGDDVRSSYSELEFVKQELEYAGRIYAENPIWPVIDVTGKAIEETAAIVLRLFHDRKNRCSMPRISKRY